MNDSLIEVLGWIGFLFILFGYFLNAKKKYKMFLCLGFWQYSLLFLRLLFKCNPYNGNECFYLGNESLWLQKLEINNYINGL